MQSSLQNTAHMRCYGKTMLNWAGCQSENNFANEVDLLILSTLICLLFIFSEIVMQKWNEYILE